MNLTPISTPDIYLAFHQNPMHIELDAHDRKGDVDHFEVLSALNYRELCIRISR
jgi:hypothetical protein